MNKSLLSSNKQDWCTPQDFFDALDREFNFTLDAAASDENAKCHQYYTVETNGLSQDWSGETVYCNPPYGRDVDAWVKKAYEESLKPNTKIVMLLAARPDTSRFHDYIFPYATSVRWIKGRLFFEYADGSKVVDNKGRPVGAPFPSVIVVFGGEEAAP